MCIARDPSCKFYRAYPAVFLLAVGLLWSTAAGADQFNGFMEWDYSHLSATTQNATGNNTANKADAFAQKYNLMMNKSFYPQLTLRTGYLFENNQSWLTGNDQDSHSSLTTSLPTADLTLGSPLLNATIGYYKRKETDRSDAVASLDQYAENYHGAINWSPAGLPTLRLNLEHANAYDGQRLSQNSSKDRATVGLGYLIKDLDLKYLFNYNDLNDRLTGLNVTQETHNIRATYSGQFFQERVSLYSAYNLSKQTTTTSSGSGMVDLPVTAYKGYSGNSEPTVVTLKENPLIISGGAHIPIGTLPPDEQPRNMGIDFQDPKTTVNRILVLVETDVFNKIPSSVFRKTVAPLYTWTVYYSDNNELWYPAILISAPTFSEDRFEIKFSSPQAQYFKVVVNSLDATRPDVIQAFASLNILPPSLDVYVAQVQAFNEMPAPQVMGKKSVTANMLNLDLKVRLLDTPSLFYNSSLFLAASSPSGFLRWTLTNAFMADQRLNEIVTASGRVGREDSEEPLGHRSAYVYNATLRATPLPTLSHTLAYSGRSEMFQGKTNSANSLYLNNTADLYRGVNLGLGGGASFSTNIAGESIAAYNLLCSLNLAPRSDLSLNINYTLNQTDLSGGPKGSVTSYTRRGDAGVTYRPFATMYLLASLGVLEQKSRKADVVQSYGFNWSPFPDGTLQFNFSYQESVRTLNEEQSRLILPSLSWQVTKRTNLNLSCPLLKTFSTAGTTDSVTMSAILRTSF